MALPLTSKNSDAANNSSVNSLIKDVQNMKTTQIFKDDAGDRRVLLGKGANGFYGLKVSQDGVDVYDAADGDLVFNSSQNVFKIVQSGTVTVTKGASASTANTAVAHGLGYIPIVMSYAVFSGGTIYEQVPTSYWWLSGVDSGKLGMGLYAQVDATNATFYIEAPNYAGNTYYTNAKVATFKYYLLQETAN